MPRLRLEIVRAFEASGKAGSEALGTAFASEKASFFGDNDITLIGKTYQEIADIADVSIDKIAVALSGGAEATDEFIAKLREAREISRQENGAFGFNNQTLALDALIGRMEGYRDELKTSENAASVTAQANEALGNSAGEAGEDFADATAEVQNWTQELNNAIEAAFGLTNAQGSLNAALESLGAGIQASGSIGTGSSGGR